MNIDELLNFQLWSRMSLEASFLAADQCYAGIQQRASLLGDPTRLLNLEPSGGSRHLRCHDLVFYEYPCMNQCFPTFQYAQVERHRRCNEEADQTISHCTPRTQSSDSTWPITQYTEPNPPWFEESFSERVVPSGKTYSSDTKALYDPDLAALRHNASGTIQDTREVDCPRHYVFTKQSAAKKIRRNRSQRHVGARHSREEKQNTTSSGSKQYVCLFTIQDGTGTRICDKRFCRTEHLTRHKNTVHCERKRWLCRMPGCEKLFSRADNLRDHYWTHLDKGSGAGRNAKWSLKELGDLLMPEDPSTFLRLQNRLILYQRFNIDSSRRRPRRSNRGTS